MYGLRHASPHPVDGRSPRKTRRICGAEFFWRARNSARIARTLEKCVSCESTLGLMASTTDMMGRGRLSRAAARSGQSQSVCMALTLYKYVPCKIALKGQKANRYLAASDASSRPSRTDRARHPDDAASAPQHAPSAAHGTRRARPLRSGATSGARCRVRRGADVRDAPRRGALAASRT